MKLNDWLNEISNFDIFTIIMCLIAFAYFIGR